MLRHNLAALFEPRAVLVMGDRPLPVVETPPRSLAARLVYVPIVVDAPITLPTDMSTLMDDGRLDLAMVSAPADRLFDILDALQVLRPRALILLAHTSVSVDPERDAIVCRAWAEYNDCQIIGPHAFGVQRPHLDYNFSLQASCPPQGRVALVAQSRSIANAVLDWASDIKLGFSAVVALEDEANLNIADVLDYLAMDRRTHSIALYLEQPGSARDFASTLRAAASVKPVVVLKAGKATDDSPDQDAVFDALLARVGAVRVRYFIQLFSALKVLTHEQRPQGRRVALFANGEAAAQLALDAIIDTGRVFPADLSRSTIAALDDALEAGARVGNPIVTSAPLTSDSLRLIVSSLLDDQGVDGILVLLAPDPLSDLRQIARDLAELAPRARKPVITCFMGDAEMRGLRHVMDGVGLPAFRTPESAANAFGVLGAYYYNQSLSLQTLPPEPLSRNPDTEAARRLVREAQQAGQEYLDPEQALRLLDCYHLGLGVEDGGAATPDDVPPMAISLVRDARYGPYIAFGPARQHAWQAAAPDAIELPPLNRYLARKLVQRSRLWRQGLGKQMSPLAFEHLLDVLEQVSLLASELPTVESLTLDAVLANDQHLFARGVQVAINARPMLVLPETTGFRHMTIHPYPRHLVQAKTFKDGQPWLLRPIRPEDAEALQVFMRGLSDESRYMRFVSMLRELTPRMLARYTHLDYDRELALVATVQQANPEHRGFPRDDIIGFAHYLRNPDGRGAEYALVIGDDWQRRGLGTQLMNGLIDAALQHGLTYIEGLVLANNKPMLALMTSLGFRNDPDKEDPGMRRVWLDLGETLI